MSDIQQGPEIEPEVEEPEVEKQGRQEPPPLSVGGRRRIARPETHVGCHVRLDPTGAKKRREDDKDEHVDRGQHHGRRPPGLAGHRQAVKHRTEAFFLVIVVIHRRRQQLRHQMRLFLGLKAEITKAALGPRASSQRPELHHTAADAHIEEIHRAQHQRTLAGPPGASPAGEGDFAAEQIDLQRPLSAEPGIFPRAILRFKPHREGPGSR